MASVYLLVFRVVRMGVDILAFLAEAGVLATDASVSVNTEAESFLALDAVGFMKLRLELAVVLPPLPLLRLLTPPPGGRFVLLDILSVAEEVTVEVGA